MPTMGQWPSNDQKTPRNFVQNATSIVLAGIALFATYQNDWRVAASLIGAVLLSLMPTYYRPAKNRFVVWRQRRRINRYACSAWPELEEFHLQFNDLINPNMGGSLRMLVNNICQCTTDKMDALYPPTSLLEMFQTVIGNFQSTPVRSADSFTRSVLVMGEFIRAHERDFERVVKKLRMQPWSQLMTQDYLLVYAGVREKWVGFIDQWVAFLKVANRNGHNFNVLFFKPEIMIGSGTVKD
jgi:hypothetical protein